MYIWRNFLISQYIPNKTYIGINQKWFNFEIYLAYQLINKMNRQL